METVSRIKAIQMFFGTPERPVTIHELRALSEADKDYLAKGAAERLGVQLEEKK